MREEAAEARYLRSDGIAFDWYVACNSLRDLYSNPHVQDFRYHCTERECEDFAVGVRTKPFTTYGWEGSCRVPSEGIRAQDLQRVLLRGTPVPGDCTLAAAGEPSNLVPSSIPPNPTLAGVAAQNPNPAAIQRAGIGSASDPIVVDDDEGSADGETPCSGGGSPVPSGPSTEAPRLLRHADRLSLPSTDVNAAISPNSQRSEGSPQQIRRSHKPSTRSPEPLYVWAMMVPAFSHIDRTNLLETRISDYPS